MHQIRVSALILLILSVLFLSTTLGLLGTSVPAAAQSISSSGAAIHPPPNAQTNAEIVIGASLNLTDLSGQWIERAYRQWAEDVNVNGGLLGRQIKLIIVDDSGQSQQAVANLERLITSDKVDLILGGYPGTSVREQMAVAERYQKVYVSMGHHLDSFDQGYTYSFAAAPLIGEWWYNGVWTWMRSLPRDQRPTKAAIMSMNNPDGAALAKGSRVGLKGLDIAIVLDETYDAPMQDATAQITKARDSGADVLITNGNLVDGVAAVRAMKTLNYAPKFHLHAFGVDSSEWAVQLGKDGDDVLTGAAITEKVLFAGMSNLNVAFEAKYNFKAVGTRFQRRQPIPLVFLMGYAWAQTLQKGVEGAGTLEQAAIRDYLRSSEIKTVAGNLRFDARGLPQPYGYTFRVKNGEPVLLSSVTRYQAPTP
jgi:branched-chain amino acid transport system substrate-binding protein